MDKANNWPLVAKKESKPAPEPREHVEAFANQVLFDLTEQYDPSERAEIFYKLKDGLLNLTNQDIAQASDALDLKSKQLSFLKEVYDRIKTT